MAIGTRTLRSLICVILLGIMLIRLTTAYGADPLRDPQKLWEATLENVLKVSTARVVLADYPLIRRDFPEISHFDNHQIDEWVLRNTAFISKQQAAQQIVNTDIKVTGETRMAFRPREYGRAHVFQIDTGGLIDVKGSGGKDPHAGFERTGLATLAEVIREFLYEKLVNKIFKITGKYRTIENYAIIDWGFNAKGSGSNGQDVRAGAILRRAHIRHHNGVIGIRQREDPVVLPNEIQLEIELALRRFGVTSTIKLFPGQYSVTQAGDQLNIQGAEDGSVVDFAGFRVKSNFSRPLYYTYDRKGNANISDADIALQPNDPRYVQPDPHLAVPFNIWGNTVRGNMQDNPFIWSEELADSLAQGRAGRPDIEQHLRNLLGPVEEKLSHFQCQRLFNTH